MTRTGYQWKAPPVAVVLLPVLVPLALTCKIMNIFLILLVGMTLLNINMINADVSIVNDEKYNNGKEKYETIKREAKMPKYGQCWTLAINELETGCKHLNDDIQHRLALSFTNCFLEKSGRTFYPCKKEQELSLCTKEMTGEAFNTYVEFFTHTQNMCHFLQAQIWQAETDKTIDRLADNSDTVAKQLHDSSKLQNEVILKQNLSLKNQELFLQRGSELKQILEDSTYDVHKMLVEFKDTTSEQKDLIFEVFDRVDVLQSLVMGEFTGFYSLIFYSMSVVISYLLTSTPRTSGARFWLFVIMTINITAERIIVMIGVQRQITDEGNLIDEGSAVYGRLWVCRKSFTAIAIFLWIWAAYRYKDINQINNQLLVEIRKQNSDLKHLLQDSSERLSIGSSTTGIGPMLPLHQNSLHGLVKQKIEHITNNIGGDGDKHYNIQLANGSSTGYGTGSTDDEFSTDSDDSEASDKTFIPCVEESDHESEASFWTSNTGSFSRESTPALLEELNFLRQATPLREMTPIRGLTIADDSLNTSRLSDISAVSGGSTRTRGRPRATTTRRSQPLQLVPRYNLRSRKGVAPIKENPVTTTESAEDFTKLIKQMSSVSECNRFKVESTMDRFGEGQRRPRYFSSDED